MTTATLDKPQSVSPKTTHHEWEIDGQVWRAEIVGPNIWNGKVNMKLWLVNQEDSGHVERLQLGANGKVGSLFGGFRPFEMWVSIGVALADPEVRDRFAEEQAKPVDSVGRRHGE